MATSKILKNYGAKTFTLENVTTNQYGHTALGISHQVYEVIYIKVTSPSSPVLIASPIVVNGIGSIYAVVSELYTTAAYGNKTVSLEVCCRPY